MEILKDAIKIDRGKDSQVYKKGENVIKVYSELSMNKLIEYKLVTERAKQLLDGRKIESPFGELTVVVNPITEINEFEDGVYAISPFVEGRNVQELLNNDTIDQQTFNQFSNVLDPLSVELIQETQHRGIYIIPYNTKITEDGHLVITDICRRVGELKVI